MSEVVLSPLAQHLAWALVHFLWQGALLGLFARGAFALARRHRPQVRYGVACLFLLACVGFPIVTLIFQRSAASWHDPRGSQAYSYHLILGIRHALLSWLPAILALWGAGAGWFALRALGSWFWLHRMRVTAVTVLDSHLHSTLSRLRESLGISRAVRLLESARVHSPFTTGLFRPVILVPLGFFVSIDPLAAEAVLAHELAHIRRLDVVVIVLQTTIETLLFYHPVTWWLSRRVAAEREHCCDDVAVQACGDAVLVAQTLYRLETSGESIPTLAPGAAGGDLLERIKRLLNLHPTPIRLTAPLLSMAVALTAAALLVGQQPVRDLVRSLPERIASVGVFFQGGKQEVKGALLAMEHSLNEASHDHALTPSQNVDSAPQTQQLENTSLGEGLISLPSTTTIAVEGPPLTVQAPAAAMISVARLGIQFTKLADAPIEPWPEGRSILEAESLPRRNHDLEEALGRSDVRGPYSYTTWPFVSSYSRRLLRLWVPGSSKAIVSVEGTSRSRKDGLFSVEFFILRTVVSNAFNWRPEKPTNRLSFSNLLDEPQEIVVVLTGPTETSYRSEAAYSPLEGTDQGRTSPLAVPLETWPEGRASWEASADTATLMQRSIPALYQLQLEWGTDGDVGRPGLRYPLGITGKPDIPGGSGGGASPGPLKANLRSRAIAFLRCLVMDVRPGESLNFRCGQGSFVQMEAATPFAQIELPWQQALQQANSTPADQRTRELWVHNPTGKPQTLVLVLYQWGGRVRPFRIDLERTMKQDS